MFSSGIVLYFIFESLIGGDFEFSKHRDFMVKARIVDIVILVTFVIPIIVESREQRPRVKKKIF